MILPVSTLLHFRTPLRVRVRATVKLSAAFFNDESSITIGGMKVQYAPVSLLFSQHWTQLAQILPQDSFLVSNEVCQGIQLILLKTLIGIQQFWKKLLKPLKIIFRPNLCKNSVTMGHAQIKKQFFSEITPDPKLSKPFYFNTICFG